MERPTVQLLRLDNSGIPRGRMAMSTVASTEDGTSGVSGTCPVY